MRTTEEQISTGALSSRGSATTEREVFSFLGEPDDILADAATAELRPGEKLLRYGTVGHRTFATLGEITIDRDGRVRMIKGGWGSPPSVKLIEEKQLQYLLRVIDEAPDPDLPEADKYWDPARYITAVNILRGVGRVLALTALTEYARVTSYLLPGGWCAPTHDSRAFALLAILFRLPRDTRLYGSEYRILNCKDIPFLIPARDNIGKTGVFLNDGDQYRVKSKLRSTALRPPDQALDALEKLQISAEWRSLGTPPFGERDRRVKCQLLRLLRSAYQPQPDEDLTWGLDERQLAYRWSVIKRTISKLRLQWQPQLNSYRVRQ